MFGSDKQQCDIWLGERKYGYSSQLFSISLVDKEAVVFRVLWNGEKTVKYKDEIPPIRNHFAWILLREERYDIEILMKKGNFEFRFKVKWPDRTKGEEAEYQAEVEKYLRARAKSRNTPTQHLRAQLLDNRTRRTQQPVYLLNEPRSLRIGMSSDRCEHRR